MMDEAQSQSEKLGEEATEREKRDERETARARREEDRVIIRVVLSFVFLLLDLVCSRGVVSGWVCVGVWMGRWVDDRFACCWLLLFVVIVIRIIITIIVVVLLLLLLLVLVCPLGVVSVVWWGVCITCLFGWFVCVFAVVCRRHLSLSVACSPSAVRSLSVAASHGHRRPRGGRRR